MKANIRFANQDHDLFRALNSRVDDYFRSHNFSKKGSRSVHLKAGVVFLLYLFICLKIYSAASLFELYSYYLLLGPLTVFLALNIGHEAAHNIFCSNKKVNSLLVYVFDFLGASGAIWKHKHVHSHHLHTNIHKVDLELVQPDIVRVFPQSPWRIIHKYQHLYMPFLYSVYTLIWFCVRDGKDFLKLRKEIDGGKPIRFALTFICGKIFFLARLVMIPMLILPLAWYHVLLAFILLNVVGSITVTFALISTHVGEHAQFPQPDKDGQLSHSWIRHQFMTTSDFSTDNRLVTELYGGFNHHLTHHLFPFVSHVHYPVITKIVREISQEYRVPIFPQPTIGQAIGSHFKLLRKRGIAGEAPLEWMEM